MTLKEMKSNVLRLIEEYKNTNELTDDEEIAKDRKSTRLNSSH